MPKGIYLHKPNQGFQKGHKSFSRGAPKGSRNSLATEFKPGLIPWNKGKTGVMPTPWNKGTIGVMKGYWLGKKRSDLSKKFKGTGHPNWKGTTPKNKLLRKTKEYRLWRESVYKRDNYTCQMCGMRGGELHADHIKPFAYFPELRFAIDNGRTLCAPCHRKTDTWGGKAIRYAPDILQETSLTCP